MEITGLKEITRRYNRNVTELHIDIDVEESAPTEIIVTRCVGNMKHIYTYVNHGVVVEGEL